MLSLYFVQYYLQSCCQAWINSVHPTRVHQPHLDQVFKIDAIIQLERVEIHPNQRIQINHEYICLRHAKDSAFSSVRR